jgi:hypothetical protein
VPTLNLTGVHPWVRLSLSGESDTASVHDGSEWLSLLKCFFYDLGPALMAAIVVPICQMR